MQARGWDIIKPPSHDEERQGKTSRVFSEGRDPPDISEITLAVGIGAE